MVHQSRDPFPSSTPSHCTGYQYRFYFFIKDKFGTQRPATLHEKPFWLNIKYKTQFSDALSDTSLHTLLKQLEKSSSLSIAVFTVKAVQCSYFNTVKKRKKKGSADLSNIAFSVTDRMGKRSLMHNPDTLSTGSYLFP